MTVLRVAYARPARSSDSTSSNSASRARPLRVAQMLACAHQMEAMITRAEIRDRAELAERFGFSRARITQLLDLLLLAPDLQEAILFGEVSRGRDPIHEHSLRKIAREASWHAQRSLWKRRIPH